MRDLLQPCVACEQHIRTTETTCPFCDAPVPEGFGGEARARASSSIARPLSRAAILFVGATAAAACGGTETTGGTSDAATSDGSSSDSGYDGAVVLYGPAIIDASTDADADSGPVAAYGPGPIDSGGG